MFLKHVKVLNIGNDDTGDSSITARSSKEDGLTTVVIEVSPMNYQNSRLRNEPCISKSIAVNTICSRVRRGTQYHR